MSSHLFFYQPTCILTKRPPVLLPSNYSLTSFSAQRIFISAPHSGCYFIEPPLYLYSPVFAILSAVILSITSAFPPPHYRVRYRLHVHDCLPPYSIQCAYRQDKPPVRLHTYGVDFQFAHSLFTFHLLLS